MPIDDEGALSFGTAPTTDEEAEAVLRSLCERMMLRNPQAGEAWYVHTAIMNYQLRRELGATVIDAYIGVLTAMIGDKETT